MWAGKKGAGKKNKFCVGKIRNLRNEKINL